MSKRCAKCEKVVYPLEELKCLDKVWHKACFRCWECSMALNMKNYKGYDKKPYCSAHYPVTKYTAVAETPEMARIAANTKMQSQVKYHEDFEKNIKGSKIQVADDPETLRIRANSAVISQVEYKGLRDQTRQMEGQRQNMPQQDTGQAAPPRPTGSVSDYDPTRVGGIKMMAGPASQPANPSPYSNKNVGHSVVYNSQGKVDQAGPKRVGSIADYDPLNEHFGSLNQGYYPVSGIGQRQEWEETIPEPRPQNHASQPVHAPPPAQDPYRELPPAPVQLPSPVPVLPVNPPPVSHQPPPEQHYPAPQHHQPPPVQPVPQPQAPPPQPQAPPPQPQPQPPAAQPASKPALSGVVYQAVYDYDAQDDDEVSFLENDMIVDCQSIDDGWMYGTIHRSGQRGMLPANYVERFQ